MDRRNKREDVKEWMLLHLHCECSFSCGAAEINAQNMLHYSTPQFIILAFCPNAKRNKSHITYKHDTHFNASVPMLKSFYMSTAVNLHVTSLLQSVYVPMGHNAAM